MACRCNAHPRVCHELLPHGAYRRHMHGGSCRRTVWRRTVWRTVAPAVKQAREPRRSRDGAAHTRSTNPRSPDSDPMSERCSSMPVSECSMASSTIRDASSMVSDTAPTAAARDLPSDSSKSPSWTHATVQTDAPSSTARFTSMRNGRSDSLNLCFPYTSFSYPSGKHRDSCRR